MTLGCQISSHVPLTVKRNCSNNVRQRIAEINGQPGIVSYQDGWPQSVFTVEARDGRIEAIYIVTNPEKLARLPPPPS